MYDRSLEASEGGLLCDGLSDSEISGVTFDRVTVSGKGARSPATCTYCTIQAHQSSPDPKCRRTRARRIREV